MRKSSAHSPRRARRPRREPPKSTSSSAPATDMWEALTAIGSIASAVVIAVTVVMAARQVKITTDQLEQTRRATQFDAARTVLLEMVDPKFVQAYRFIIHELPARMNDVEFY